MSTDTGLILKNTDVVAHTWGGIPVAASSQVNLVEQDLERLLGDETFHTNLTSGNAVINDGTGDLAVLKALSILRRELDKVSDNDARPGYLAEKLSSGTGINIVVLNDGGDETLEIIATGETSGATLFALFSSTANSINNKFLNTENVETSDSVPAVAPVTDSITRVSFSNKNIGAVCILEFRINTTVGVAALSITVDTLTTKSQVVNSLNLPVIAGDEINCKVIQASGVGKALVKMYI